MKIIVLAPLGYQMPPKKYGGAERAVFYQIKELAKRGHKLTVFCYESGPELEELGVEIVSGFRKGESLIQELIRRIEWVKTQDVLFDHSAGNLPSKIFEDKINTISMTHGMGNPGGGSVIALSVDQHARWIADGFDYASLVLHNGFDLDDYPMCEDKEDYILYMGKINEIKGTKEFLEMCIDNGLKAIVAGQIHDPHKTGYGYTCQMYMESPNKIEWVGEVGGQEKLKLLQKAKCFVFPTLVREACPLVPVEAMLCGTPVATWDIGPMREIVKHKQSGYVAKVLNTTELYQAVKDASKLNPIDVANFARKKFSIKTQISLLEEFFKLYEEPNNEVSVEE